MNEEETQRAIRDALLAEHPDFSALPPRMAIYRRLVRNTLADVVHKILPRTRARMGKPFDDAFEKFLEARGPRTHHLRDVPRELVAWATEIWRRDKTIAPWLVDLAHHELTWFSIATAPHVPEPRAEEVSLDHALLLSSLARVERFAFAVHEDFPDDAEPDARAVAVLYYRDEKHDTATMELSALFAELLSRGDLPLRDAIAGACESSGVAMNDETLATIARFLAELAERGVLLGAR